MRRIAFFALAATTACGISVVGLDVAPGTTPPVSEGGVITLPDGAVVGKPTDEGGSLVDATDAGDSGSVVQPVDAGCQIVVNDSFTAAALDPRWKLAGNAKHQNQQVELTQSGDYMAEGGLWWSEQLTFGTTLTAVFEYSQLVSGGDSPGVGIAIGWVKSNPTWRVGDQGLNLGICNSTLSGVAAGLRLSGSTRLDAIAGVDIDCQTSGGHTPVDPYNLASGILTLKLTSGLVTAITNGEEHKQAAVVPTSGVIGFTASTGTQTTGEGRFAITRATVEVCP